MAFAEQVLWTAPPLVNYHERERRLLLLDM